MTASDLETTMSSKMEVRTEDTGAIAVPARMLLDILKAFPDIPLTVKVDPATHAVELTSDAGKYKLTGANGDEFPAIARVGGCLGGGHGGGHVGHGDQPHAVCGGQRRPASCDERLVL